MSENLSRPVYELTLPSEGRLYGDAIPGGVIKYSPMTAKEEKLLAGAKGNAGGVLDAVLASCLPGLPIPVGQLLMNDRFFILIMLRAMSYGEKYQFSITCSECNTRFKHEVILPGDFPIRTLDEGQNEPFEVSLPINGKTVLFRLLRGDDEKAIQRFADQQYAKGKPEGDPSYTYRLARHVVNIDGEEYDLNRDMVKAVRFIESLIGKDSLALRNAIDDVDCGIDVSLEIQCPRCDFFIETSMPMTSEFFRPRS